MLLQKNGLPLYYQVKNYLRDKILKGEWAGGEQIPTELQLIELFGVSRATLRQAISDLCNEGLLNRIQGKGTFVTDTSGYGNDPTEILEHNIPGTFHQPISCIEEVGLKKKSALLAVDPDEIFTVFSYLHHKESQEQIPYNLCMAYFPKSRFPNIEKYFYTNSVYTILKEQYHIMLSYTESELRVINLTKEQANHLKVKVNTPTIKIEKVYYDTMQNPVACTDIFTHPVKSLLRIKTQFH